MRMRPWPALAGLLGAGLVIRLVIVATSTGDAFDLANLQLATHAAGHHPLGLYATLDSSGSAAPVWPYPPLGLLLGAPTAVLTALGLSFARAVRVVLVLVDLTAGLAVHRWSRARGASDRTALLRAAAVVLGPAVIAVSSAHGQLDVLAFLPAVAGVVVAARDPSRRGAIVSGALIGVGAGVKTVPLALLLAVVPTRPRRDAVLCAGAAVAVVGALLLPWAVRDLGALRHGLSYQGIAGRAGWSLVTQPQLGRFFLVDGGGGSPHGLADALLRHGAVITVAAALVAAYLAHRSGVDPIHRAAIITLALVAASPAVLPQYVSWPMLPLALCAAAPEVLTYTALTLPFLVVSYLPTFHDASDPYVLSRGSLDGWYVPYVAVMALGSVALAVRLGRPPGTGTHARRVPVGLRRALITVGALLPFGIGAVGTATAVIAMHPYAGTAPPPTSPAPAGGRPAPTGLTPGTSATAPPAPATSVAPGSAAPTGRPTGAGTGGPASAPTTVPAGGTPSTGPPPTVSVLPVPSATLPPAPSATPTLPLPIKKPVKPPVKPPVTPPATAPVPGQP